MVRNKPMERGYVYHTLNPHMVDNAELAQRISELPIANHYGAEHVQAQKPFSVDDQDDQWVVRGARNKDHRDEGFGPAKIIIRKKDGAILDMHIPCIMHPHPDVKPILDKLREAKQRDGQNG